MSFFQPIRNQWHKLTGADEYSAAVPVMDGPLKPNDGIETSTAIANLAGAANLATRGGVILFSRGAEILLRGAKGDIGVVASFEADVTALAVSRKGTLAVGLAGEGVSIVHESGQKVQISKAGSTPLNCVTALCFRNDESLVIANGSAEVVPADWVHDLMQRGASGFVASASPGAGHAEMLVSGLQFPSGICLVTGALDKLAVSEAWSHRVIELSVSGKAITGTLLDQLPSYPSRIMPLSSGGYVLSNYSIRSQLIEFVLREKRFLRRMRDEVAPEHWIAPRLTKGVSFKEPLQAGGVIRLGIHKPWAPTRSYGLLIGLTQEFQSVWSAHSRADGHRHGVTSVTEIDGRIAALSQGNGDLFLIEQTGQPVSDVAGKEDAS